MGSVLTTFTIVFPRAVRFFEKMRAAGVLKGDLPCSADTTRGYTWNGYTMTPFAGCYYRFLGDDLTGSWRKVSLHITHQTHPREDDLAYEDGAQACSVELRHLGIRMKQVGVDHFGRIEAAVQKSEPRCRGVTSLWHLVKNIRRNQRKRGAPKILLRPLGVVLAYIYTAAALPGKLLFHLDMLSTLDRIRGWGDAVWADYFENTYCYWADYYGERILMAKWHCGLGSGVLKGHGP